MHKLAKKHPTMVNINGLIVPINSDFRFALEADQVLNSSRLKRPENNAERVHKLLYAMYDTYGIHENESEEEGLNIFLTIFYEDIGTTESNIEQAILQALWFLRCGEKVNEDKPTEQGLIDFEHDSHFIYSALLKKGVDLDEIEYMHWWKFVAHFSELPEGVTIGRIAYLRNQRNKGKLTEDEKKEIKRLGRNVIDIYDEEAEEDKAYFNRFLPD